MISHQSGSKIATIILAAGESKRMKGIKQLLPWKDTTLLTYAIRQAVQTETDAVFVVLGANKEAILSSADTSEITIIINKEWRSGMGSSIAAAVRYIRLNTLDFDAVLIKLIDQPLLDVNHYNKLIYSYINLKDIVTTSYGSAIGVPAVFDHKYFDELMLLNSNNGAKEIIKKHKESLSIIDSKGKTTDLDDYPTYLNYYNLYGT